MDFLDKIGPFVLSIGGIGDFLLSLNFIEKQYGSIKDMSIVCWANNQKLSLEFFNLFKQPKFENGLKNVVVFQGWQPDPGNVNQKILQHKNYKGRGHIPDDIGNYVGEWTDRPEIYLNKIQKPMPLLMNIYRNNKKEKIIGLFINASSTEKWKSRSLSYLEFPAVINKLVEKYPDYTIRLFGAEEDKINYEIKNLNGNFDDCRGLSLNETFIKMSEVSHMLSVDSFGKTFSGLLNIPTTIIKTRYIIDPKQKMNLNANVDPSDKIFLNKDFWNFEYVDVCSLLDGNYDLNIQKING